MPEFIKDEDIWNKAIKAYGKKPKDEDDYAQITAIYKKMGGQFEGVTELLGAFKEFLKEDNVMNDNLTTTKLPEDDEEEEQNEMEKLNKLYNSYKETKFKKGDIINYQGRQYVVDSIENGMYKLSQPVGNKTLTDDIFVIDGKAKKESLSPLDKLHNVCKEFLDNQTKSIIKKWVKMGKRNDSNSGLILEDIYDELDNIDKKYNEDEVEREVDRLLKESLSPLDRLYESVCKENIPPQPKKQPEPGKKWHWTGKSWSQISTTQKQPGKKDEKTGIDKLGLTSAKLKDIKDLKLTPKAEKNFIKNYNKYGFDTAYDVAEEEMEESLSRIDNLYESVCKEAKFKPGDKVKTPEGKVATVRQYIDNTNVNVDFDYPNSGKGQYEDIVLKKHKESVCKEELPRELPTLFSKAMNPLYDVIQALGKHGIYNLKVKQLQKELSDEFMKIAKDNKD